MTKSREHEFTKYVRTHNKRQVRELLEGAALVLDPLGRELLKRAAK